MSDHIQDPFTPLADWIQEAHLSAVAINRLQAEFESSSLGFLRIPNFLHENKAQTVADFLTQTAAFRPHYGLYKSGPPAVSREEWDAAEEEKRFFSFGKLSFKDREKPLDDPNYIAYIQMRKSWVQPAFHQYIAAITNTTLIGTRIEATHRMTTGQFIRPHNDLKPGRRFTFLIYLSPHWQPDYGGALHLIGKNGETLRSEVSFNTCVIFDITKHQDHYVSEITPEAGDHGRFSIAARLHESVPKKN